MKKIRREIAFVGIRYLLFVVIVSLVQQLLDVIFTTLPIANAWVTGLIVLIISLLFEDRIVSLFIEGNTKK